MVLTTSFPLPLPHRFRRPQAREERTSPPGSWAQRSSRPSGWKPSAHAQCASGWPWAPVLGLFGPRTCFESRREARWGRRGGGEAASRAGGSGGPGRFHFFRALAALRPTPDRPARGFPRPRSPATAGLTPPSSTRRLPRRFLRPHPRSPPPPSSWCGPGRAHHGD